MKEDYKVRYWREALECALDEIGAFDKLTKEEIAAVAASLEVSAECQSMAFGYDCIPNPQTLQIKELERKLEIERNKVVCKECNGAGSITTSWGSSGRSSTSSCSRCRGKGKI